MERKQHLPGIFSAIGILILILDGQTALTGARTGIDLCLRTVIPALFPFFFLSVLLTSSLSGITLLRPLGQLLGIPEGAEGILVSGFLGGYPVGAQAISRAWAAGRISRGNANRMLSFCSNAGPAFLFGMVSCMFSSKTAAHLLWLIHIGSAVLVSFLFPPIPESRRKPASIGASSPSAALVISLKAMATVCGWVILFRVLLTFLQRWGLWMLPDTLQVILTGLLELSNGCCELSRIPNPELRFVLCSGMLAWGGLCVTLQTCSVTEGLSIAAYLKGKSLQTVFSLLLSAALVLKILLPVTAFLLLLCFTLRKMQNSSRNPAAAGV